MLPNNNPQHPSAGSDLPAVPPATMSGQGVPQPSSVPQQASANPNTGSLATASALQARQAMQQYAQSPHALSAAWQEIKANYLAQQYHITTGRD